MAHPADGPFCIPQFIHHPLAEQIPKFQHGLHYCCSPPVPPSTSPSTYLLVRLCASLTFMLPITGARRGDQGQVEGGCRGLQEGQGGMLFFSTLIYRGIHD